MPKLYIMRGLPASGKSTRAAEILKEDGNAVRLNKDLLRKMLHCGKWSGKNEKITTMAEQRLAEVMLGRDHNVIIDDTNLNPKVFESWKAFNPKYEIIDLSDVDIETCVLRDEVREDKVGSSVIVNMARKYGLYKYKRKEMIVDIDGTVADISHRKSHVEQKPKDWKTFFSLMHLDEPRKDIIARVVDYSWIYNIVFVSGRPEEYRKETEEWLNKHVGFFWETLIMRPKGDGRQDDDVKQNILNTYFDKSNIYKVIDDRPRVIRMWQKNGLEVEDVGDGVEF